MLVLRGYMSWCWKGMCACVVWGIGASIKVINVLGLMWGSFVLVLCVVGENISSCLPSGSKSLRPFSSFSVFCVSSLLSPSLDM